MDDMRYRFFVPLRVRCSETDMQGHVFFGNYLDYFDVAALDYTRAVGYGVPDFLKEGLDFFYAEALCRYKSRALFDETLHVHARVGHIGNTSFRFEFAVFEELSGRLVCEGHIVAVVVEKASGKPARAPDGFRSAVEVFEKG